MDISIEHYYRDLEEEGLRTFCSYGKIGLHDIKSDNRTMPSFYRIITSDNYIFVEVGDKWGMLDKELRLVLPTSFKEIIPVRKIDIETFISANMANDSASDETFRASCVQLTHIAVQSVRIKYKNRPSFMSALGYMDNDGYDDDYEENSKAVVYEIIWNEENIPESYVLISDNATQLVNIRESKIERESGSVGVFAAEFYRLSHYKENLFVRCNNDNTYGFVSYIGGRFISEVEDSSKIIFHKNGFVSICLGNTRNEKYVDHAILSELAKRSGKWALFKFGHKQRRNWEETEIACLHQQTPFAFTEALKQIRDGKEFICRAMGKEWLVKYDNSQSSSNASRYISNEDSDKASSLIEEYNHSGYSPTLLSDYINMCFTGELKVSSEIYNAIEVREGGLFNIYTDDGYGVCDENMKVLIPAKYDSEIGDLMPLMIVEKNNRFGVVNNEGKDIVPCAYDYIKISKIDITIWDVETDYDPELEQCISNRHLGFLNDSESSKNLIKDGYFIVCINIYDKKECGIFKKMRFLPNYYLGQQVMGSICDVYLPNGRMVASYDSLPNGGIEYFKDFDAIMRYEKCLYDENYGMFYENVQLDFFKKNKCSSMLLQALPINSHYYLAFNSLGHVGIGTNDSEEGQSEETYDCSWALPDIYNKLSLPINGLIYAFRDQDNKQIVDIIEIRTKAEIIISLEIKTDIYELKNIVTEHISAELKDRLVKKDDGNKIVFFPFEEYYDDKGWGSNGSYRDDGSYRDAFEDDPEAMWGREW